MQVPRHRSDQRHADRRGMLIEDAFALSTEVNFRGTKPAISWSSGGDTRVAFTFSASRVAVVRFE
jgi:hypothetical protein